MQEVIRYVVHLGHATFLALAALLPIVNPIGSAALFLALTEGHPAPLRQTLARKIAVNSFFLLGGSVLVGTYVLRFFGISIPVVQIGGGLVVLATGWSMLNQKDSEIKSDCPAGRLPRRSRISLGTGVVPAYSARHRRTGVDLGRDYAGSKPARRRI